MKKILLISALLLAFAVMINAQIAPGIGANTEDPKKILLAAEEAMSKVRQVSYEAKYEGTGAFSVRTSSSVGKLKFSKLEAGNPLMAKIAAEGEFYPAGEEMRPFVSAFTGDTVYNLRPAEMVLRRKILSGSDPKERDFGMVTMRLGVGTNQLTMYEFLYPKPFEKLMAAQVLEYEGRTIIGDVLCHVVYGEMPNQNGKISRERWYIGIKDNLPRQRENVAVDDKGRYGAYVLTLTKLQVNMPIPASAFVVKTPKGYAIEDFKTATRPSALAIGETAPEWKLTDASGKIHSLSDYRGQIVVMDFWSTWCGPCVQSMPEIQRLHNKFQNRGVKVFGVNSWEESNAPVYFNEKKYTYNLLLNGETIGDAYRVSAIPVIYVVGMKGEIIYHSTLPDANLTATIERYLQETGKQP